MGTGVSGEPLTPGAGDGVSPRLPPPGTRIGQYEVIRELGRGGMGAVYLARDTKLGRRVAIKFLYSDQPELTARFILEARATARCSHENIVVIHEVGEHEGCPFMVLEHLEGAPLTRQLEGGRELLPAQAVELMVPVVRALVRAHAHNIVHRDLKPDNIFVTESGTVKVLDFGIAKLMQSGGEIGPSFVQSLVQAPSDADAEATGELTRRGALVGTIPYMSPEQWAAGAIDHRTDLWAVGIILFKMVAGRHPLGERRGRELMITGLINEPMPSVRDACPSLPDELATIIDRCLIKPLDRRMGSARELLDALEPLLPGRNTRRLRSDESPYAGLNSFQESDAHRFFGRTRAISTAVARLRDGALLGVVGPSGVGKSSFVRAGIVPALKASGQQWSALVVRPGRSPMAALAYAIAPIITNTSATVSDDLSQQHAVQRRLYEEPGYLGAVLRSRARRRGHHTLLFVDQFEELYTLVADPRERRAFTACLAGVCDDATTPLRLVLSLRSDFLDQVPEDPRFMAELTRGLFFLTPPDRDGLRDALIEPAQMAGYQFEDPAMVESMLDHLEHTPGALPLLQFAASQLWDTRDRERHLLTADSYDRIGGIAGALASHADAVVAECTAREQLLVRALFLRVVTPERTRAVVPLGELYDLSPDADEVHRVIDRLVRSRLLVTQTAAADSAGTAAGASVEIVHESLIHSWPRLQRWLDETQDDAAFLDQLRSAAKQWQAKGYPQGLLWRGEAMEEARLWHSRYRGDLPELQRAYLNAVFALSARTSRRKRLAVVSAMGFLSALVVVAGVALVMIRDAQTEATAQARRVKQQLSQVAAAQAAADAEREKTVEANQALETKNGALLVAVEAAEQARRTAEAAQLEAEAARVRAEKSKRRERRSKRKARQKEKEAREAAEAASVAAAEAKRAGDRLADLLEQERQRVEELKRRSRGSKIVTDVSVE